MILYIVDDERNIRDSLSQYISWDSIGIHKVYTAKNGLDALGKMKEEPPDILLSDIRMPKMDGIHLATNVKELYPDCIIIFLSGYADKDYLKSAISLQAMDYIEKPLHMDSIKLIVSEATKRHQEKNASQKEHAFLEDFYKDNRLTFYESIVRKFTQSEQTTDTLKEILASHHIDISPLNLYTVILLRLFYSDNSRAEIQSSLFQDLYGILLQKPYMNHALGGFTQDNQYVLLMGEPMTQSHYTTFILPLLQLLKPYAPQLDFSMGIGSTYKTITGINNSYNEACIAASMSFYKGLNHVFHYKEYPSHPISIPSTAFEKLQQFVQQDREEDAQQFLNKVYIKIASTYHHDISYIKDLYLKIILSIMQCTVNHNKMDFLYASHSGFLWETIRQYNHLDHLHQLAKKHLTDVLKKIRQSKRYDARILEIMAYIDTHYMDNQLTISKIADDFELSQAYLCAYFKKSTDMTLNQYITKKRIDKSKALLRNTHNKIYEIGLAVGFTDTNYFSSLFKRHVGVTPIRFRERILVE